MKKFLALLLSVAMTLGCMGTIVFADNTATTYQVGVNETYADLNAAITANAGAEDAIYEIYGEVELEIPGTHGDFDFNDAKVIGMDDDARVTVVGGGVSDIINVNMESVKFADAGTYSSSSSEFMYQNFSGTSTFVDVEFLDGVRFCNSYVGTSAVITVSECSFYEDSENEYPLWIDGGEVTITDSSIEGTRGVKLGDARYTADNLELEVSGCKFKNISKKPAFVVSNVDSNSTVVIEKATLTNCDYGLLVNEVANYKGIEVDGKSPAYVASKGDEYYTDMAYALKEAGDSSNLTEYVAEKDGVYFESLAEAMTAKGTTVNLLKDIDLGNVEWEPVSLNGAFNGNGHTISNLKINKPDNNSVGFITSLNGVFENVNFVNVDVVGKENVGAVAGRAGGGAALAKNITVTGDIKVESTNNGYARAAVIVGGWAYGRYIDITVDGGNADTSYVKWTGSGDGRYCAGIVGHADDVDEYTNCVVKNITIDGDWLCGGIAGPGPASSTASGCVVENVKIDATYSGGMFGWFYTPAPGAGVIEDCTVKDVEFTKSSSANGAIGGYGMNTDVVVSNVTIENVVNANGRPLISYLASIDGTYYATLADAVEAADEDDVIDLMGNTIDLPEVNSLQIKKDLTIQNGTIDITDGTWNGNAIIEVYGGTATDYVEATFNNVDFVGDNYSSAYGVIYAYKYGKAIINGCDFDLSNEKYSAGGVLKGNTIAESAFDVTNSTFDLENPNRVIALAVVNLDGVTIDAKVTDDTLVVGDMNNHAFRNLVGTVRNSTISADGFETGIKNTDGNLTISDNSVVTLTNSADTDLVLGAGVSISVSDDSVLYADTSDIADNATVEGNVIAIADAVYVQFKKTDIAADGVTDTAEDKDEYEIVLASKNAQKINELASADLTFAFNPTPAKGGSMSYTVLPAEGVTLSKLGDRYMFNYDGVTKYEETGAAIVIGTITVDGYGSYTLATNDVTTNAVYATEIKDNIVEGYKDAAQLVVNTDMVDNDGMVGEITAGLIAVPTRTLTINLEFPNAINGNVAAYQDMKVEITGNIDGVNKTVTYDLGATDNNGGYVVTNDDLVLNNAYTVTVSGAGYRTARYTVTMTEDKTLNFWNNVKDAENKMPIEDKTTVKVSKNFLAGDIVKDNNINIYDLSAVVSYFNTATTTSAYDANAKYDLNRDGVIDSKDVAYVLVSWGE